MEDIAQTRPDDVTQLRVSVGDVADLTLGQGSGSSEDKRYQYN